MGKATTLTTIYRKNEGFLIRQLPYHERAFLHKRPFLLSASGSTTGEYCYNNQLYTYHYRIKLAQTLFTQKSLVEHSNFGVKS
jgi:hypothetical protein